MIEQLVMLIFIIVCILATYTFQFTFGKFIVLSVSLEIIEYTVIEEIK